MFFFSLFLSIFTQPLRSGRSLTGLNSRLVAGGRIHTFPMGKCNQSRPGFELVSPCPFPTTISITPRAPAFFIMSKMVFYCAVVKTPSLFLRLPPTPVKWTHLQSCRFDLLNCFSQSVRQLGRRHILRREI